MRRILSIIFVLFTIADSIGGMKFMAANTASDNPLATIARDTNVVRGHFQQEKYLAELDQPLLSSGSFVVAMDLGLVWRVEQPVNATLIIDEEHMVQRIDGRQTLRLSRDEQPGLSVIAAVLIAVFQKDLDRLRDFFDLQTEAKEEGRWRLLMQPKAAGISDYIDELTVSGADQIDTIEIDETNGDRSVIRLSLMPGSEEALTAQERSEFGN